MLQVMYPEALADSLKMRDTEFEREIKVISLVKLYELGKISSGLAAKVLDISRVDFLDLLAKYEIPFFPGPDELEADFAHA